MREQHSTSAPTAAGKRFKVEGRTVLKWLSFAAATLLTATAERDLFMMMGADELLAWAFPVMLDCYAAAAFRSSSRANVAAAILLMIVCQGIAHVFGPHDPAGLPVPLVIAVSCVAPIVLWRIHELDHKTVTAGPDPAVEIERLRVEHAAAAERTRAEHAEMIERLRTEHAAALTEARRTASTAHPTVDRTPRPARRPSTTTAGKLTPEQIRERAEAMLAEQPGITKLAVAKALGITDRWLREVLNNTAAAAPAAA